jgi:hypothetical protein
MISPPRRSQPLFNFSNDGPKTIELSREYAEASLLVNHNVLKGIWAS